LLHLTKEETEEEAMPRKRVRLPCPSSLPGGLINGTLEQDNRYLLPFSFPCNIPKYQRLFREKSLSLPFPEPWLLVIALRGNHGEQCMVELSRNRL
jgi:hypothetical protein